MEKPILVVGATGRHGGTGGIVARMLLERKVPVRALVRTLDQRAEALRALGAELVQADLHDRLSLIPALEGIEAAYFTYPVAGGIVEAAANFASAGRSTGLKRLVVMSMGPSHPQSPSHLGRAQWLAEDLFGWAGFNCLHLRIAAVFLENIELCHRADIEGEGVVRNAFPDIPVSWITGQDCASIAVAALLTPEKFEGGPAVYPGSPHQYTQSELVGIIGEFLGRKLRYESISMEAWRERLMPIVARDSRLNEDMVRHISSVAAALHNMKPLAPNDMIERVTGVRPMSLHEALASRTLHI
ncbi:NmrA family NAD(P)-binding protein [Bradyrhizobium sp. ISRA443]|uniref:NmrA family NAD(P)-binding protein n=1 Tax=unclassified Bradyrhizobium TaxID=2631580 RepID=UPI00247A0F50|nr:MULTISPECIES: NmrA family NAD(P)-binding protein [unclassified Bradyrhizobium]WGR93664.1 NmrA family NAD(P)-binding protein [Bradyrhizobium sp. ISRA435]WGR98240.1 NmrA family NAD(P)-binding protein [Bradyrhizobium sp. ISRA436]WGS05129.1 NmrA family NAD(P)-binding protein [Bradyrhizobium sp. ISRA437]WGS12014.1 NmrA family NAD(P)-binding protein [Bradyrhizobium sp. ISRA443]